MAKSLGNFITIEDGLEKYGAQPLRMLFLLSHYSSPLDFSEDAAKASGNALSSLHMALSAAKTYSSMASGNGSLAPSAQEAGKKFISAMDDDFDTPTAMAALFSLAKKISGACSEASAPAAEVKQAAALLEKLLSIFGLMQLQETKGGEALGETHAAVAKICNQFGIASSSLDEMVLLLISARDVARKKKDFASSDAIRAGLAGAGILLEDRKDGTTNWRKN